MRDTDAELGLNQWRILCGKGVFKRMKLLGKIEGRFEGRNRLFAKAIAPQDAKKWRAAMTVNRRHAERRTGISERRRMQMPK